MKNLLKINALIVALFAIVLTGCNENTNPVEPGNTAPNAPTAVMAKSNSTSAIGLMWAAASTGSAATGFQIEYNEVGSATKLTKDVTGGSTVTAEVDGLTAGTRYEFVVYAVNAIGKSPASASVAWAPADVRSTSIRLYSSLNNTNGSGASIITGQQLRVAQGGQWDICFDDKDGRPLIGSPGVSGYVDNNFMFVGAPTQEAKTVSVDTALGNSRAAASISDIYSVAALDNGAMFTEALFDLSDPRIDKTKGFAFTIRIRVNNTTVNFGRVLVKSNGTDFVNGTGADSYLEIETSYQTVTNVPHAIMQQLFSSRNSVAGAGSNSAR